MYKSIDLFAGIGGIRLGFEQAFENIETVFVSEIDANAQKTYKANFNDNFDIAGDITKIDPNELPQNIDLVTHGSPCQDFSLAGKQAGGDEGSKTRSSLMWNTVKIIECVKPKYVIWENVRNLLSKKHKHNFEKYIEVLNDFGYNSYYEILNAKDYGIPQNRERVFCVSILGYEYFEFPKKQELKLKLKDMLEDNVPEKYYLSQKMVQGMINTKFHQYQLENRLQDLESSIDTLTTSTGERAPHVIKDIPKIPIKNATNKGYLEAELGDGIDISSRMEYHRGTVQKGKSQTITTMGGKDVGVVVYE